MEISYIYTDRLYDECETEEQELLVEERIKEIEAMSKTHRNIVCEGESIFVIGDAKEILGIEKEKTQDIIDFLNCNNCSDSVEIEGLTFLKSDCIEMLDKNLKLNEAHLMSLLFDLFSKSKIEDFAEKLINSQFKYAVEEKINKLQNIIKDDNLKINWR